MQTQESKFLQSQAAAGSAQEAHFISPQLNVLAELCRLIEVFTKRKLKPAPAPAVEKFHLLPAETKKTIERGWIAHIEFIKEAMDSGLDAFDEKRMMTFAFRKLGLMCDAGAQPNVEATDVSEIYGPDLVQVYRSYSYFALCNYSLLELSVYSWLELYERSSQTADELYKFALNMLNGSENFISLADYPEYFLRETMTAEGAVFAIREKFLSGMKSSLNGKRYVVSVKSVREATGLSETNKKIVFI